MDPPPLNANAFEKFFDKIGLDKDDKSLPGWMAFGDICTNVAKEKKLVQESDHLMLRDVRQKFHPFAAALLIKYFGNSNIMELYQS